MAARSFLASKVRIEGREDDIDEKEDLVVEEGIVMVQKLKIVGKQ